MLPKVSNIALEVTANVGLACGYMPEIKETENLRVRVSPAIKHGLDEFASRKKTSQQATINGLLEWFLRQDGLLQSLIITQIEPEFHADIVEKVLKSLASEPSRGSSRKSRQIGDSPSHPTKARMGDEGKFRKQ